MNKVERFEIVSEQKKGLAEVFRVLRDKETGVLYLQTWSGASGGITVMFDADGKPLTQP